MFIDDLLMGVREQPPQCQLFSNGTPGLETHPESLWLALEQTEDMA